MAFEKLREIIELDVEYTTKSALAISAGKQPAEVVEAPVIKLAGMPVIPGSSLKGALRSTLEAMLAQQGVKVCVPFAAIPKGIRGDEQRRKEYLAKLGRLEPCQDIENPCPICAIFGTIGGQAGLSGRAIVLDATTQEGKYNLIERTHVAIMRDTKSQAEGSLMSLQAVDAGAVFEGKIRIVNPEDWQVGAIAQALKGVKLLGMGAKKTAGYGELEIEVKSVRSIRFVEGKWESTEVELEPYIEAFAHKFGEKR